MKLEVGKTYIDRNGDFQTIVRCDESLGSYSCVASDGGTYLATGQYNTLRPNEFDLIAEAPASVALSCIMVKQMEMEA